MKDGKGSAANSGYKVLIVDDDTLDLQLVEINVRRLWPHCKIVPVQSMQEAYEEYKKRNFDLILLDLNLPDTVGPSTVQEMRRFVKSVPIVVVTGFATNDMVKQTLQFGASSIHSKSDIRSADFGYALKQSVQS